MVAVAAASASTGCLSFAADDCEQNLALRCAAPTFGSTGTAGSGGGTPADCVPRENPSPVKESCGIFVSSSLGDDTNTGTKSAPVKTVQQAIEKAGGRPVYACAEELIGSVTVTTKIAIYGGLDCAAEWAYVGATQKTTLTGAADTVALTLTNEAIDAEVVDIAIYAANAVTEGSSSIAVLVDGAAAAFTRCDLIAGDGAAGVDGEDALSTPAPAGAPGNTGEAACSADAVDGAAQVSTTCGSETSIGGQGGDGKDINGTNGSDGAPLVASKGFGGKGETVAGWDCSADGVNGGGAAGAPGAAGTTGPGASADALGTLSVSGFLGAVGADGEPGKIGQGGGGGGGAKGGAMACMGMPGIGGASGGSGGAGGCGGAPGKGGLGGGASVALVSLKANITLNNVTLTARNGGRGGAGGDPQPGGDPGAGGAGGAKVGTLNAACKGGDGGPGGNGGAGGGGRGGHTIGVAYVGTAPSIEVKQITLGSAELGGLGGGIDPMTNQGADGIAAAMQEFPE